MHIKIIKAISSLLFLAAFSAWGGSHSYVVAPDSDLTRAVAEHIEWSRDYGSYVWVSGSARLGHELGRSGVRFSQVSDRRQLQVHGFSFDPLHMRFDAGKAPRRMDGAGLGLVQFRGPIARADINQLRGAGMEVIQYYPHHSYLVWGHPDQLQALDSVDAVRWSGDFSPEFRLHPRLAEFEGAIENLNVHFYNDGNPEAVLSTLRSLGAVVLDDWPAQPDRRLWDAKIVMDARQVEALASVPQVISVNYMSPEPELEDESGAQTLAGNIDGDNVPVPGYEEWLSDSGVDGSGVIWAISDTGIYYDHPDFAGRIAGGFSYPGCTGVPHPGAEPTGGGGHGTHVAGIVGGSGAGEFTDGAGHLYGLGVAPGVEFFAQNPICGSQSSWPPAGGWSVLSRDALAGGAIGANNSWTSGEGTAHGYQNSERSHDIMVLDGNFDSSNYEPFMIVFSAGNSGPGSQSLTAPKEAKNVVVTGGTQTYRAGDIDNMYNSSSRGPAVDGRVLPTVGAPGQQVSSAIKPSASTCTNTITGTNGLYSWCTGTSMAAPHVSGALALMSDWWRQHNAGKDFSPALGKALLINTARNDIDGGSPVPNNDLGWGRTDLRPLLDAESEFLFEFWDQEVLFEDSGEEWTVSVGVVDPSEPLRISLVWSDAPGAVGANPALVNDLDLEVTTGGELYLGNAFSGGWSTTGGSPDRLNNLENVFVQNPGGSAEITVRAYQIAGSVLVNDSESDAAQHFALVCQNCQEEPDYTLDIYPATQMVCAPEDGEYDIEVGSILGFDDPVSLSVESVDPALGATLSDSTVAPPASSDLTISGTEAVVSGSYTFDLVAESTTGTKTRSLVLEVTEDEPAQAQPLTPDDDAMDTSLAPLFSWDEVPDTDSYQIQIATGPGFDSVVLDELVPGDVNFEPDQDLDLGTSYFWRVRAQNFCGNGTWSDVFSFTTRLEPEAEFSATEFGFSVSGSGTDQEDLVIGNIGTGNLNWSVITDQPEREGMRDEHDPALDEDLLIEAFELPSQGAGIVTREADGGLDSRGMVTGFTFEGTVAGISGTASWASDMQMTITAPDGTSFTVGGFSTPHPDWDFQGSGSDSDGTYASTHVGPDIFGAEGVEDVGTWEFQFEHTWNDPMDWSDVTLTLHKAPLPVCGDELTGVDWLSVSPDSGVIGEGEDETVQVMVDGTGLADGEYVGFLCLSTNDPAAELVPMPVELTVSGAMPGELTVDPAELAFGEVPVGIAEVASFTVSNAADPAAMELGLSALEASGDADFEITGGDCAMDMELEPGDSCQLEVTFTPSGEASFGGQVTVSTDDGQSETVELSGEGFELPDDVFWDRFEEQ